jgi:DNA repair protein RadA/Sms
VLEKRANIKVSATNVFVNITGGIRASEPAIDLAVCIAITSSLVDKAIDNQTIVIGEVGLGGEIRSIGNIEKRIQEAEKLGFKHAFIPSGNVKEIKHTGKISIGALDNITSAVKEVFL